MKMSDHYHDPDRAIIPDDHDYDYDQAIMPDDHDQPNFLATPLSCCPMIPIML